MLNQPDISKGIKELKVQSIRLYIYMYNQMFLKQTTTINPELSIQLNNFPMTFFPSIIRRHWNKFKV